MQKKLLFFIAEDSYFCSHRINLAKAAQNKGYQVAIATRCNLHVSTIQNAGIRIFPLKHFKRSNINPWLEVLTLLEIFKIYKEFSPDIVHQVAFKPVIWGSLISYFCKVPQIINALGGLGYLFTTEAYSFRSKLKKLCLRGMIYPFLKWIFSRSNSVVILQNEEDIQTLTSLGYVKPHKVALIRGAGIDPQAFPFSKPTASSPIVIACISRMLWSKGIGDLVKAADILQKLSLPFKIILYGLPDDMNPNSISLTQLNAWKNLRFIQWEGHCKDVAKAYTESHIAVLPSFYREGIPKTLLEAASCGRPIVTTNVAGCKDVVVDGMNGFIVPPKSPEALAAALSKLMLDEKLRIKMGENSRKLIENAFSDTIVNNLTLALYSK